MAHLKPHQVEGVEWILHRERSKPSGGMLCDEMGLGKTIQMLEAMLRNRKMKSTLIVVPKSIVGQWKSEIAMFAPLFSVCIYDGSRRKFDPTCDVCVCPYSVLADLQEHSWGRVVLDEGHEIRNRTSLAFKTAMRLKSETYWILTGTPVFNKFKDFVSLCQFIRIPVKKVQACYDDIRRDFILRRIKTDITELDFQNVELEMYPEERRVYEKAYGELYEHECILEGILRCRQVCSWPKMYDESWEGSTAKMDSLVAMINKHPDEKSLVFTQFTAESQVIKRRLVTDLNRDVFVLNGQTENRSEVIQEFKDSLDPGAVFIIQIKTGGVGLNLQEATRVYITQPSWNPATELQAIARSHRTGQTKPVIVRKLVYAECDAVDNEITELQILKSEICSRVLGDDTIKRQIPGIKFTASSFSIRLTGGGVNVHDQEDDAP